MISTTIRFIGAAVFSLLMILITIFWGTVGLLTLLLPYSARYRILIKYGIINLWLLEKLCGISFQVHGQENIPQGPAIIFAKHQSTWETLAMSLVFPNPQCWAVKRELLWLPFFGWVLSTVDPIVIKRGTGHKAVEELVEKGIERLKKGRWVVVFPEGTRVHYGERGRYRIGGGVLAARSGYPVIPMAHNAGRFWGRRSFLKQPGLVEVFIGPPIASEGREPQAIVAAAEEWIETTQTRKFYEKDNDIK